MNLLLNGHYNIIEVNIRVQFPETFHDVLYFLLLARGHQFVLPQESVVVAVHQSSSLLLFRLFLLLAFLDQAVYQVVQLGFLHAADSSFEFMEDEISNGIIRQ